jgi:4,5-dihydroxyphthalate decarboxylase
MTDLPLTLTCADYPRLLPLAAGLVKPAGIALRLVLGRRGDWGDRAEMLRRAGADPAVHGGEFSMAQYLYRIDKGDRSLVGLPAYPLRNLVARDLYVRRGGPVRAAEDLKGARIGMYAWGASGSVWYRHFLRFLGVAPEGVRWTIGNTDAGWGAAAGPVLPEGVASAGERSLSDLLLAGAIDAVFSPPRPALYHPKDGPIARLFPDFRPLEQDYWRATGVFPPQHLIVLRRAVWEANPWIAPSLAAAFAASQDWFSAMQRGFPYSTPWEEAELEATRGLMGDGFHADGLAASRGQVEEFCAEAHRLGLTSRLVGVDEYFADFLAS